MDYLDYLVIALLLLAAGAGLYWWHRERQAAQSRAEARRRTVELRDRYYAEQMAQQAEWLRAQQAKRAIERANAAAARRLNPDAVPARDQLAEARDKRWEEKREAERQRNLEARRRLDNVAVRTKPDERSTPGQPLYDGSVHALDAGEVPRSISGLSGSSHCGSTDYGSSYSCSGSGSSDSGSSDSGGSCGGGD